MPLLGLIVCAPFLCGAFFSAKAQSYVPVLLAGYLLLATCVSEQPILWPMYGFSHTWVHDQWSLVLTLCVMVMLVWRAIRFHYVVPIWFLIGVLITVHAAELWIYLCGTLICMQAVCSRRFLSVIAVGLVLYASCVYHYLGSLEFAMLPWHVEAIPVVVVSVLLSMCGVRRQQRFSGVSIEYKVLWGLAQVLLIARLVG